MMENNTFHAKSILGERKEEKKRRILKIIKYVSVSRFYLPVSVSISGIFVAPKKDYPLQLQFT